MVIIHGYAYREFRDVVFEDIHNDIRVDPQQLKVTAYVVNTQTSGHQDDNT